MNSGRVMNLRVTIPAESRRLNVGKDVIRILGSPAYICVLQRKDRKSIAITPCAAEHPMSFKVPDRLLTDGQCRMMINGIENVIMMMPFSAVVMWTFEEKIGNGWKKILWQSGKIAFIFSISIEMLQLLLRLGTFQLSDIFYNTVGGVLGGIMYCAVMKARKHL